jgi:hypothetical protein
LRISRNLLIAAALLQAAAAKPWDPQPPCAAPPGIDEPAVPESMCQHELAHDRDIVVREYGLPASAALATASVENEQVFAQALSFGLQLVLEYFGGANANRRSILSSRTTPITVRNIGNNETKWIVGMMVSTSTFPDNATIPKPSPAVVQLENVGLRMIAAVQFSTRTLPEQPDFDAACGRLFNGRLPKGFVFDMDSSWSPTYVLYNSERAANYTSECWAEVKK